VDHRLHAQPDRVPARSTALPPADHLPALFAQALDRQRAGHAAEAAALYECILAINADLPEIHNNLGAALVSLGRLVEAEAAYHRAVAIRSDYAEAYYNLGSTLAVLRRFDEAEPMYRRALALMPDFAGAYGNLGHTLRAVHGAGELKLFDRAAAAIRSRLPGSPAYPEMMSSMQGEHIRTLGTLYLVFRHKHVNPKSLRV
jgi:tetratricopeptide (TPR) repeat protein